MFRSISLYLGWILTLSPYVTNAQQDTILEYDLPSATINTILPITFDPNITFESTSSSIGNNSNKIQLSLVPPTTNLFTGSNFSDIVRVTDFFNPSTYPARTAVALRYYGGDSVYTGCSGILVSNRFVLTAGHCFYIPGIGFTIPDSIKVAPGFHNGVELLGIGSSLATKAYIFKSFYSYTAWDDVALLQLKDPIGSEVGWVGMGFDTDPNNYLNKVFHKFSYPGRVHPVDSTKIFNGDTMYYNYGFIDNFSPSFLSINGTNVTGIQGQSGSSFLYTDNIDYYSVGVMNFSNNYTHFKITNKVYYHFKNILEINATVGIKESEVLQASVSVYPNPFSDCLIFEFSQAGKIELEFYSITGQLIRNQIISGPAKVELNTNTLEKGMYFLKAKSGDKNFSVGKFIKD